MTPLYQSRIGEDGTCLRTCIASILDLSEFDVPDFGDDWYAELNEFLAKHGLRYVRVPIDSAKPSGYSTIEGISPRGGLHAVVGYDGEYLWDPHPFDGTGRFLVEPRYYGRLDALSGKATDRADMLALRSNTTKQGGPFFMQETTENGNERTLPVKNLRRY